MIGNEFIMDTKRIVILAAIAFVAMQLWTAWQADYGQKSSETKAVSAVESEAVSSIPQDVLSSAATQRKATQASDNHTLASLPSSDSLMNSSENVVRIKTDVLDLKIDRNGANIIYAALPNYPTALDKPNDPVVLLNTSPKYRYLAESTLIGENGPLVSKAVYSTKDSYYELNDKNKQLTVDFVWQNPQGVEFVKQYGFTQGSYDIHVQYKINNQSNAPWQGNLITQLSRTDNDPNATKGFFNIHAYFGASISTQNNAYQKLTFADIKKKKLMETSEGGWAAMQQHYFLSAWIPQQDQENLYYTHTQGSDLYTVGIRGPDLHVDPSQSVTTQAKLFVGPELTDVLKDLAPHLDMTVDYGWLWFISDILYWLLAKMYLLFSNWGWAIIATTIFIKLAFYPLSAASYRSMSKMRALQPKISLLRERYADDRQKLTQETMALYRREKINPFGGCLPILIQIPIFISLYWVLVESVELRQAPFIFWIQDLAVKDPYFILPILMGVSMVIQQRMNPAPPDPTQAKIMMFLPVVFTLLFMNFPAGLVLYWVVNNSISILQQWYIMNKVNGGKTTAKKLTGSSKSSKTPNVKK